MICSFVWTVRSSVQSPNIYRLNSFFLKKKKKKVEVEWTRWSKVGGGFSPKMIKFATWFPRVGRPLRGRCPFLKRRRKNLFLPLVVKKDDQSGVVFISLTANPQLLSGNVFSCSIPARRTIQWCLLFVQLYPTTSA